MDYKQLDQIVAIENHKAYEYLLEKKYFDFKAPYQLDMLLVDITADWLENKLSDLAVGEIFGKYEANPMHHNMEYSQLVYEGVEILFYFSNDDIEELKKIKQKFKDWYQSI